MKIDNPEADRNAMKIDNLSSDRNAMKIDNPEADRNAMKIDNPEADRNAMKIDNPEADRNAMKIDNLSSDQNYKGHRSRLREKFTKAGNTLPDYEILELLLFLALPRQDVKPLAKTFFKHFKTFQEIICSDLSELKKVKNVGENTALTIKLIHEILQRVLREQLKHNPQLNNQEKLIDYLKVSMAYLQTEQFRVLFLNKKHYLIKDEIQQTGTIDQAALYIREIIRRALDLSSTNIILVHNHPTGDPTPSKADIESTMILREAALPMDITLLDHIIIGRYGFFSMREQGLL